MSYQKYKAKRVYGGAMLLVVIVTLGVAGVEMVGCL